jgi:hypothetical protein
MSKLSAENIFIFVQILIVKLICKTAENYFYAQQKFYSVPNMQCKEFLLLIMLSKQVFD